MQVVIIAGGKGTRIKSITKQIPKALLDVAGKTVLERQIELFKNASITNIYILTGYLANTIEQYFQDGNKYGVNIIYLKEPSPLGTAGSLSLLKNIINDDFVVVNGDQIMDFDVKRMIKYHQKNDADATLFLHPNDHPYDSDLVEIDNNNKVTILHPKPHMAGKYYKNLVNAGVYIFKKNVLDCLVHNEKKDMGKDLLPLLLRENKSVYGYISTEYVKDIGIPDRYKEVINDFESGKVTFMNINNKRPAIFLDRDGVINKEINLLSDSNKFELLNGVAEAIKKINESGYLVIVITNQPVIARNLVSFDEMEKIHNKMEWLLGSQNTYLDRIYFCPHHPDSGFSEERKEFKIKCNCRKPKPGMILKASKELNIDLEKSYMIGDRDVDMLAAKSAGIQSVLVKTNGIYWNSDNISIYKKYDNLEKAVDYIISPHL